MPETYQSVSAQHSSSGTLSRSGAFPKVRVALAVSYVYNNAQTDAEVEEGKVKKASGLEYTTGFEISF